MRMRGTEPLVSLEQLKLEQSAFDERLPAMLREHGGQFVVFHVQEPVEFYPTYLEAYRAALERFGAHETFLIAKVEEKKPEPASLSWEAAVLG